MKTIMQSSSAPAPIGPYSQAVRFGSFLFVSGQIGIEPVSGEVVVGGVEAEARQVMNNIGALLATAGMDYTHIVKTTIFLRDMADFAKVNAVYGACFSGNFPARETVAVVGLPKNVNVEISVIAAKE